MIIKQFEKKNDSQETFINDSRSSSDEDLACETEENEYRLFIIVDIK